ncbi:MAG: FtsQ-type POTRA domain-containing protein [Oscillospiraceae bacterium]|nr:FtsQ-type POTRA domain-containing protein [Oscillospiraceae bacterium]
MQKIIRSRKGGGRVIYIPIAALLIALLTIFGLSTFLRIMNVEVSGVLTYTEEEIVRISGIVQGDNMLLINRNITAQRIVAELPHISAVSIVRIWPDTVRIEITESVAVASIRYQGSALIIDSDGRILQTRADAPDGLIAVRGLSPTDPVPGSALRTEPDAVERVNILLVMLDAIETAGIQHNVSELDMTNLINITIRYSGRINVRLGSTDDVQNKLRLFSEAVEGIPQNQSGTFDMRDSNPSNWRFQHD